MKAEKHNMTNAVASSALGGYTPWRAARFYVPLLLQAVSQSLTYPLVASIVSHGGSGVVDLAAFAQGQSVMFMIGALGGGLITTGMVFGRDREGWLSFKKLNFLMAATLVATQFITCLPPFHPLVFNKMLGLASPMDATAREVLFLCLVLQFTFFMRNPWLVTLYNARASAVANWATLCRIIVTASLSPLFVRLGWTGTRMGVIAMSGPVLLECLLLRHFAQPYVRRLTTAIGSAATAKNQLFFTIPLSFGGFLLSLASFMVGAFIARADDPSRMLPIHYVALGIVNPVSFAAMRMQAVVLAFPPRWKGDGAVFRFALVAGLALALFPWIGQVPSVAHWYFGKVQNVPLVDIPLASRAMLLVSLLPITQSLRGHAEGLAAWRRRPAAILAGQAVYLATLVSTLFVMLNLGTPGYMMGVVAILVASFMTFVAIRLGLMWAEMDSELERPAALTSASEG